MNVLNITKTFYDERIKANVFICDSWKPLKSRQGLYCSLFPFFLYFLLTYLPWKDIISSRPPSWFSIAHLIASFFSFFSNLIPPSYSIPSLSSDLFLLYSFISQFFVFIRRLKLESKIYRGPRLRFLKHREAMNSPTVW